MSEYDFFNRRCKNRHNPIERNLMKKLTALLLFISVLVISAAAFAQDVVDQILPGVDFKMASKTVLIILVAFLTLKCASDILTRIAAITVNTTDNKMATFLAGIVLIAAKLIDQFIGNSRNATPPNGTTKKLQ